MPPPDANVLHRLEHIGERLIQGDIEIARLEQAGAPNGEIHLAQREADTLGANALDGLYDVTQSTVALLRALECACLTAEGLSPATLPEITNHLRQAALGLQLALLRRWRERQQP